MTQLKTDQVCVEYLVHSCKQHQIVRKKQTVDHVASNSDTFVDLDETVHPIHTALEEAYVTALGL